MKRERGQLSTSDSPAPNILEWKRGYEPAELHEYSSESFDENTRARLAGKISQERLLG